MFLLFGFVYFSHLVDACMKRLEFFRKFLKVIFPFLSCPDTVPKRGKNSQANEWNITKLTVTLHPWCMLIYIKYFCNDILADDKAEKSTHISWNKQTNWNENEERFQSNPSILCHILFAWDWVELDWRSVCVLYINFDHLKRSFMPFRHSTTAQ